jgi:hypothetical protein
MVKKGLLISAFVLICLASSAQRVGSSPEYIKALTAEWKGERFPDGRPKVSDKMLERLKKVHLEEAWGVLRNKGYQNQFEGDWMIQFPDSAMTGRVVTAQYMPMRPDVDKIVKEIGKNEKRIGETCEGLPNDIINFLHDPLACAIALGYDDGVEIQKISLRLEEKDGFLYEQIDPTGPAVRIVTSIDGPRFNKFWLDKLLRR